MGLQKEKKKKKKYITSERTAQKTPPATVKQVAFNAVLHIKRK
jgi:hypothetical protein